MSARTWDEGDPEPADRPAVVNGSGVTCTWTQNPFNEPDSDHVWGWVEWVFTYHKGGGVSGPVLAMDWRSVLDGGPLREATVDEVELVKVKFLYPRPVAVRVERGDGDG